MDTNLPEVANMAKNFFTGDRGHIFSNGFLTPQKIAINRTDAQKAIYIALVKFYQEFSVKKLETTKELEVMHMKLWENIETLKMEYNCKELEMKLNFLQYTCEKGFLTPEMLNAILSKLFE